MADNDKYVIEVDAKTNGAQQKLEGVAKATKNVGKATADTKAQSQDLGKTLGGVAEAGSNVAASFGPAGSSIALVANAIRGLKAAMSGVAGGITVLIGAVIGIFSVITSKIREYDQQAEELAQKEKERFQEMLEAKAKANELKFDASVRELEREKRAADDATNANQQLLNTKRAMLNAEEQEQLLTLDIAEKRDLAAAVGDTEAQERIRRTYAAQRTNLQHQQRGRALVNAKEDAAAELAMAQNDKVAIEKRIALENERRASFGQERDALEAERAELFATGQAYYGRYNVNGKPMIFTRNAQAQKFIQGDYQMRLNDITKRQKAYEEARATSGFDAQAISDLTTAETRIATAQGNFNLASKKLTMHAGVEANLISAAQTLSDREYAHRQAQKKEQEEKRAKEAAEAEAKAEAERQKKITEAEAVVEKERDDVSALEAEAAGYRTQLAHAADGVQVARTAHARTVQTQIRNRQRLGSRYDRSQQLLADSGALLRTAEGLRNAETAFNKAAEAANNFFKTFDAALKREQGEAERAAQRLKAAREMN